MVPLPRRLFIGLLPDRKVQAAIQRHCRDWEWPDGARPTRFGRYHLTLHFLDYLGLATEQRLREALRDVAVEPLELELAAPADWHKTAALRPTEHAGLKALYRRLTGAVAATGLKPQPESHFRPHVTLARNAVDSRPPQVMTPIGWRVDEFVLIWSRMPPEIKPSRYEIIERFGVTPGWALQAPASSGQVHEQLHLFG
jgi:RNA 2',3'-cyclic 3'-phosphodiesterase